jgi:hypothetical protein
MALCVINYARDDLTCYPKHNAKAKFSEVWVDVKQKQKSNSALKKKMSVLICVGCALPYYCTPSGPMEINKKLKRADCRRKGTVGQRAVTFASQGPPVFGDSCVVSEHLLPPENSQTSAFVFRAKRSFGSCHLHTDS